MPKQDPDLESLRTKFKVGNLYLFDNERALSFWSHKGGQFSKKLKSGQIIMFLSLERSHSVPSSIRVSLMRGEEIGYVIMKRYEVISCLQLLDIETA